jgi:hypothetical protein
MRTGQGHRPTNPHIITSNVAAGLFVRRLSSLASLKPRLRSRSDPRGRHQRATRAARAGRAAGAVPARAGSGRRSPRCRQRRPVGRDAGQRQHLEQSHRAAGWTTPLGAGARHVHQPRERRLVRHLRYADDRRPRASWRRCSTDWSRATRSRSSRPPGSSERLGRWPDGCRRVADRSRARVAGRVVESLTRSSLCWVRSAGLQACPRARKRA